MIFQGHLVGSIGRASDSWSWGHEFELHTEGRGYIKKNKILNMNIYVHIYNLIYKTI